jgi:hypothetical protein
MPIGTPQKARQSLPAVDSAKRMREDWRMAGAADSAATGGRAWTWGYGQIGDDIAEAAYKAIRESTTDVAAISRYTNLRSQRLQRIKDYLFKNPEWTGVDGEIAAAWHRLRTGRGTEVDKLLLKHETAEMWLRRVKVWITRKLTVSPTNVTTGKRSLKGHWTNEFIYFISGTSLSNRIAV